MSFLKIHPTYYIGHTGNTFQKIYKVYTRIKAISNQSNSNNYADHLIIETHSYLKLVNDLEILHDC